MHSECWNPEGIEFLGIVWSMALLGFILLLILAITVVTIFFWWRIFRKAGFPGPLALLALVPAGKLVMVIILAFMDWPVLKGKGVDAGTGKT